MSEQHECAERVWGERAWNAHPCSRRGVIMEGGKWWCKQHAPSSVKARATERDTKWRLEREATTRNWRRREAEQSLMQAAIKVLAADLPDWAQGSVRAYLDNQEPEQSHA